MYIKSLYEYRPLERVTNEDGSRFYTCPVSGTQVASVTTILDQTSYKPELEAWKARVGPKAAKQIKDEAASLGSLMHSFLESHIAEVPRPRGNYLQRNLAGQMADVVISRGLAYVEEVWGIEIGLCYPQIYAGTTDLIGVYKGRPAIIDFKTTRTMKTRNQIEDYFCQLCAYSTAHDEQHATNIETGVIFMVSRDLKFETFLIKDAEFEHYKCRWLNRLEKFLFPNIAS